MTDWTLEELAKLQATRLRRIRLRQAQQGPRSTTETRIALVAFELGLSDSKLEQFYFVNRKDAKKRHFDTEAFAKKYGISIRWIWEGNCAATRAGWSASKPGRAAAMLSPRTREGMRHDDNL